MSDVVLLHGFTQNSACWGRFAPALAGVPSAGGRVLALDAPGHGRSVDDQADLWATADLVVETVTAALDGPPASASGRNRSVVLVGYSMGGRTALHVALAQPERVRALVLIGATAGIAHRDERARRRAEDEALARRIETEPLEQFLDWWLARPLFAGLDEKTSARAQRMTNRPDGLAASLRRCGTGAQVPLWDRLDRLSMPVLLLHGRRDPKFSAISAEMAEAIGPSARRQALDGTHAVHLERPDRAAEAVARFLESLPPTQWTTGGQ